MSKSLINQRVFVGIDYHQDSVQVCVMDAQGQVVANRSLPSRVDWIVEFVEMWTLKTPEVAIECCCGAANLAEELRRRGWLVRLAHAGYCNRMKQNPDKTDHSDAYMLADLVRIGYLPEVWLPPNEIRELRRLTRHRQELVDRRRETKLRIRAILRDERQQSSYRAWSVAWFSWLADEVQLGEESRWVVQQHLAELEYLGRRIREVEERMQQATSDNPLVAKLLEQKGVGLVTAITIVAEIGTFDRFRSGKQLARYCAVTPRNVSSGSRQAEAGMIKAGNMNLRPILIETAHRLCRFDPKWKQFKERLKRQGKPGSVAVGAVANRWVRRLYWQMLEINTAA